MENILRRDIICIVPKSSASGYNFCVLTHQFRAIVFVLISIAIGAAIGVLLFRSVVARDTRLEFVSSIVRNATPDRDTHDRFSGTVLDHNEGTRTIVLNIRNSFPPNESRTSPVQLSYTADTQWFAVDYIFRDGVMMQRRSTEVKARPLPKDALVNVILYHDGEEYKTIAITYLRRVNI